MPVLRRLLFRLLCPSVLLLGELHVWLADQVRGTTGWRRCFALLAWAPCRVVFVAGYGALVMLEGALRGRRGVAVMLIAFDVLAIDGRDVTRRPYWERQQLLEALGLEGPAW